MRELPALDEVGPVIDAGLRGAAAGSVERAALLLDRGYMLVQREGRHDAVAKEAIGAALDAAEETADANLVSAALDLEQAEHMHDGRYGDMYRSAMRRLELLPRLTDVREIADAHAMRAWSTLHLGRYRESEAAATAASERARGIDAGAYLHGLTWRVAARFMLGDWEGALADQAELERVAALDSQRDVPASFSMRAYTQTALCHFLRGDDGLSDRYVDISLRYFESRPPLYGAGPAIAIPLLAHVLALRGRFDEALAVLPLVVHSGGAGLTYQVLCEVTALREAWDEAAPLVSAAREEAAAGELLALPLYTDRLEGRTVAAAGEAEQAAVLLRRSADGFGELEAPWEEAWSRLLLGEVLLPVDREQAERELAAALTVFDALGSVREAERARAPLAV
jgi:hypothetical protein